MFTRQAIAETDRAHQEEALGPSWNSDYGTRSIWLKAMGGLILSSARVFGLNDLRKGNQASIQWIDVRSITIVYLPQSSRLISGVNDDRGPREYQ